LLGDLFELSLLDTSTRRLDSAQGEDDDDRPLCEVRTMRDVPNAVETLAALIAEHAAAYAERYTSHQALLMDGTVAGDLRAPALLAAVGRFEEAGLALDRYEPSARSGSLSRRERRTAYQLRRWLNSHGDAALLPSEPPPSDTEDRLRRPSLAEISADVDARREATDMVRRTGRGRDRDELRQLLERELAHRGVTESPLGLERALDHLWDTPAERFHNGVQGLRALGRMGLGAAKAIRDRELPDWSRPQWLEPPEPAYYELARTDRWAQVTLEDEVEDRLERIHHAVHPRVLGIASLTAWLKTGPNGSDIAVHIGQQRLGVLPADTAAAYRPIMQSAAFREEFPVLAARLTHRAQPPRYLLEINRPPC
jgi:hypothetical protein